MLGFEYHTQCTLIQVFAAVILWNRMSLCMYSHVPGFELIAQQLTIAKVPAVIIPLFCFMIM